MQIPNITKLSQSTSPLLTPESTAAVWFEPSAFKSLPKRVLLNSTYPSRMTRIITGILTPIALRYEDSLYAIYTSFFSTMSVTMPVQIYMLHSDATKMGTRNITCTIAERLLHSAAIRTQAIAATPIGRSVSRMIMAAPSWEKASTPPMLISIDPEAYTNAAPTEIITSVKH